MAKRNPVIGGQASAIRFSRLTGASDQAPVLKGTVSYAPTQIVKERVEDVHSPDPHYINKHMPGSIKMTIVADSDLSWLNSETIEGADLQVLFTNGRLLTATGVTLAGDPTEINQTEGESNELTFYFVSATLK